MRKPVDKIVVITHPFFKPARGEEKARKLEELSRIIRRAAKDAGTHVIVSWSKSAPHPDVARMLDQIPAHRVHQPSGPETDYRERNFFLDDALAQKRLAGNAFAPRVRVESWGDYQDRCALRNLFEVVNFVQGREGSKVTRVSLLGGAFSKRLLNKQAYGKGIMASKKGRYDLEHEKEEKAPGSLMRMISPYEQDRYDFELEEFLGKVKTVLPDKKGFSVELAWPIEYWKKRGGR